MTGDPSAHNIGETFQTRERRKAMNLFFYQKKSTLSPAGSKAEPARLAMRAQNTDQVATLIQGHQMYVHN